jgi:tetratricopeptide (TPR) repeat protein
MPAQTSSSSVFISHSSKDNEFVDWLAAELEKYSIKFWLDEHRLRPGDSLYGVIGPALMQADYFLIVLSKNSVDSVWVERELNVALGRETEEKKKIIIPVLLENVAIPTFIRHKKYANFTSEDKFASEIKGLLEVFGVNDREPEQIGSVNIAAKLYPDFFLPDLRFFVGRETLLDQIKTTLNKDHRAVIHDISGLGKTFTSYKFVNDNHRDYEKIFWVRATKEEMLESLAKCGEIVNPLLAAATEQQIKALGFKQWLEANDNWLVVYDNVDLPNELFKYVPFNKAGDGLFTSNFREAGSLGTEVSIAKLNKTDAQLLLYRRAYNAPAAMPELNEEELEAFHVLIQEIDGLPLTLNSVGALIYKKQWTFETLKKKYAKMPEITWESEDPFSVYQKKSAGRVFWMVYEELCGAKLVGDAVKIILDSVSFISPDEIPEDLLQEILRAQYESFAQMEEPDDFWDDVREKLTDYDLLKYDKQKRTFNTHRAIQRVIQSRIKKEAEDICSKLSEILINFYPVYDYSNRPACEKYYQHALTLTENAGNLHLETAGIKSIFYRLGRYQELLGNFWQAERFYLRATDISSVIYGVESANHAADLNNLANVYQSQGRYDEAIGKLEEAFRIAEKTIGREHPHYAGHLSNLAVAYRSKGRYDEAIEKYEEALRIDEKTIGKEHPNYAVDLNNLANVYRSQGKYDEAIEKYKEALRIAEKTIGKEHPDYAIWLSNLAGVYETQGKYEDALDLYEAALRIDQKTLPEKHPYTIQDQDSVERCRRALKSS